MSHLQKGFNISYAFYLNKMNNYYLPEAEKYNVSDQDINNIKYEIIPANHSLEQKENNQFQLKGDYYSNNVTKEEPNNIIRVLDNSPKIIYQKNQIQIIKNEINININTNADRVSVYMNDEY